MLIAEIVECAQNRTSADANTDKSVVLHLWLWLNQYLHSPAFLTSPAIAFIRIFSQTMFQAFLTGNNFGTV
ncbi:MAG: hypothetical protein KME57_28620 [Scytonema hyalinum WJT4-NPBG1]|jgi:hypothetical protein|nr:hypothetical protein [Scytonema hyalinum WJT4-NPBG1]